MFLDVPAAVVAVGGGGRRDGSDFDCRLGKLEILPRPAATADIYFSQTRPPLPLPPERRGLFELYICLIKPASTWAAVVGGEQTL